MKKNKNLIPFDGIIGTGKSSNWTPQEYDEVSSAILKHQKNRYSDEKINGELSAIKLLMGNYLLEEKIEKKIIAGTFLKKLIKATNIKNKIFAKYIGLEESNLSSIISGRRKINMELALTLEQIFDINPSWWSEIQLKNDFLDLKKEKKKNVKKYSLKGLLKKVG